VFLSADVMQLMHLSFCKYSVNVTVDYVVT